MKFKKAVLALVTVMAVLSLSGCALFGGGDWQADVVNTLVATHDDFTMETEYTMQESGLYYSVLPVKLEYTTGDDSDYWWATFTQYDSMGNTSLLITDVAIMNSRGDRFVVDSIDLLLGDFTDALATGRSESKTLLDEEEISQLYQVFTDIENLEYIQIRFNGDFVYEMTQPQAYAVTYFIDYIRNQVQPTEV